MEYAWNDFVEQLEETKRKWRIFQAKHEVVSDKEKMSVEGQKIYGYSTCRSDFFVALPRILDLARMNGGLSTLKLKLEKKEETKDGAKRSGKLAA